jgi:hypothetical protein
MGEMEKTLFHLAIDKLNDRGIGEDAVSRRSLPKW